MLIYSGWKHPSSLVLLGGENSPQSAARLIIALLRNNLCDCLIKDRNGLAEREKTGDVFPALPLTCKVILLESLELLVLLPPVKPVVPNAPGAGFQVRLSQNIKPVPRCNQGSLRFSVTFRRKKKTTVISEESFLRAI